MADVIGDKNKAELEERVMHNHDVSSARAQYATNKAQVMAYQSQKTLNSSRDVARGFEA